jgi:hypothetical protein
MDLDPTSLLLSLIFGSIGVGYFIYGKKQGSPLILIVGLGLMVFPYFISNLYALVIVGIALTSVPPLAKRFF